MVGSLKQFWNDESGPELVEWAVVTIILLLAAVVLYIAVGKALGGLVCSVKCWINQVASPDSFTGGQSIGRDVCKDQAGEYECDQDDVAGNP
jgi:Flp pilus assembly pilin Flp